MNSRFAFAKRSAIPHAIFALVLCVSLIFTGCASSGNNSATSTPQPQANATQPVTTTVSSQTSTPAKTTASIPGLKVGTTRQIKAANPISDYWFGVLSGFLTQESLVRIDAKLNVKPGLAEKWEVSEQATLWKFYITKKAKWHDGTPVTPADVKFSIEYRMAKDPQSAWMKDVLKSVEIQGDVVVLRLSKPYSALLTEFDTYRILPKHVWEKVDDPLKYTGDDAVLGCGPYQIEKMDMAAGTFRFKANPDYFEGKPSVERVDVFAYRNVDTMVMALSKGEIDVTWDYSASLPYTSVPPLEKAGNVKFAREVDLGVPVALGFNMKQGPAADKALRQAISYAIDYGKLAELVFVGYGKAPKAGFVPYADATQGAGARALALDAKKANEILDAAGLKDVNGDGYRETAQGAKLELNLLSRTDSDVIVRSAELLQGYLKTVGLTVKIRSLDTASWTTAKDKMDYDLVLLRTTPWGMLMHAGYASGYFDSRRTGAGVLHNVDDPTFLALCDEILSSTDPIKTKQLQGWLVDYYANEIPGLALAWADNVYPYLVNWDGWRVDVVHGGPVNRDSLFTLKNAKP